MPAPFLCCCCCCCLFFAFLTVEVGVCLVGAWLAFSTSKITRGFREKHTVVAVCVALLGTIFNLVLMVAVRLNRDNENWSKSRPSFVFLVRTIYIQMLHTPMFLLLFVPKLLKLFRKRGDRIDYRITTSLTPDQRSRILPLVQLQEKYSSSSAEQKGSNLLSPVSLLTPPSLEGRSCDDDDRKNFPVLTEVNKPPLSRVSSFSSQLSVAVQAERITRKEEKREVCERLSPRPARRNVT